MKLLWLCVVLCAAVFSSINARYAPRRHHERGLRTYSKGHHNGGHKVLGAGVVPLRPEDIAKGIEPEVTEPVQFIPTARPQPQTEKSYFSWDSIWDSVNDFGDDLGDVASNVGDTVVNWGEDVGESVGNWGESVGETFNEFGERVGNTVGEWGDTLGDVAEDIGDKIGGVYDDAQDKVQEAQIALVAAARIAGDKLKKTYQDAKEGLPSLREQVLDSLQRFGILVGDGAKYVYNKLTKITDQVHSSAIIQKLQEKLEQGDEQVAEFLQLIGHKIETWFQSHTQLTQHADIFQDAEIQDELQQLVDDGILTANDVNILVSTSQISSKLQQLMERGDDSVTGLIQLLTQKIARWYEENGGSSVSQVTQQVPTFFQDEDVQEELKELVEQGTLTESEIQTLVESTSVVSKLQEAIERGDERVTQIFVLINNQRENLEQQQDQHNVEIMPDIFQDDEVQADLQNLVDVGTITQDEFDIMTKSQSQQGHIYIEKRTYKSPEKINVIVKPSYKSPEKKWLDSIDDTFSSWGEVISDTASDIGETVSDWGSQGAEYASNVADQVVDVAGDIKDAAANALQKKKRTYKSPEKKWLDSVDDTVNSWGEVISETANNFGDTVSDTFGDTFNNWGETLSDTASNVGETVSDWGNQGAEYASNVADQVVDVAGDIKDAAANALQKKKRTYKSPEKKSLDSVDDTVNSWGEVISETANNFGDSVSDTFGDTFNNWGETLSDTASNVGDLVSDTFGDTFNNWGETLSDTASNVDETVRDWGNQGVEYASNVADQVVDVAGDIKDTAANALQKKSIVIQYDPVESSNDLGETLSDTADNIGQTEDIAGISPALNRMLRTWIKNMEQRSSLQDNVLQGK